MNISDLEPRERGREVGAKDLHQSKYLTLDGGGGQEAQEEEVGNETTRQRGGLASSEIFGLESDVVEGETQAQGPRAATSDGGNIG